MLIAYPHMVNEVDSVIVVTELTLAAARDTIRLLASLRSLCPGAKVILVANKVPPAGVEISRKDFETSIERVIDFVVPLDAKMAVNSAKLGKCFGEAARGSKGGLVLNKLVQMVVSTGDGDDDDGPQGVMIKSSGKSGGSLLGKLGDLSSLIPKKKAKA